MTTNTTAISNSTTNDNTNINNASGIATVATIECEETHDIYMTNIGIEIAVPEWEAISTAVVLTILILLTIIGNILVILSVFTYKPLRIVQNFFIVSLAVADLTVALLVMPFNVAYSILGRWYFGINLCKIWLTCDVLCCTASILNLCAIALDRFWAITDPINYAQKRTLKRVLIMIAGIWALSLLISSPPLVGWNDWPKDFNKDTPCQLTSQKGYVIYSSLGSFYIPLIIMTIVYIEIFIATRRRLRERARASKINTVLTKSNQQKMTNKQLARNTVNGTKSGRGSEDITETGTGVAIKGNADDVGMSVDRDSVSSETNHNEHPNNYNDETAKNNNKKNKKKKKKLRSDEKSKLTKIKFLAPILPTEDSITDIHGENSSGSNQGKNSLIAMDEGLVIVSTTNTTTTTTVSTTNSPQSDKCNQKETTLIESVGDKPKEKTMTAASATVATTGVPPATANKKLTSSVYQFVEEKQRISLSKERRAARTLGIIMGVFVVCWLPFFLMYVILPFCPQCCATKRLINFITWLGYINSALNPIIYTIFNLEYRRAFKKLLGIKV